MTAVISLRDRLRERAAASRVTVSASPLPDPAPSTVPALTLVAKPAPAIVDPVPGRYEVREPVTKLGIAIDAICAARSWECADFARHARISPSTVSRLRSGQRPATRELLDRSVDGLSLVAPLTEQERVRLYESAGLLPDWEP